MALSQSPPGDGQAVYANPAFQPDYSDSGPQQDGRGPPAVATPASVAPHPAPGDQDTGSEVDRTQKANRDKHPLFYCHLVTKHPKAAFGMLPCKPSHLL